ncbi:MAG: UDP-2,4-diacetamido-2,4,6-trideoxy-beta-L-altropyranose hydrolase [Piscirickettsiaceae bacterium]|nr:MAG: UDP-2,4-diacetamido-2,4,6-trideoxy-beta-L-altropyranose hydrolase [Piscirickettsiaceae bacterium]
MRAIIRVDASRNIGTGHVMRCLTLAEALKGQGAHVEFICRAHVGNLITRIEQGGFKVHRLPNLIVRTVKADNMQERGVIYGEYWLGSTQEQDSTQCLPILEDIKPDLLIVDHYSLNYVWQSALAGGFSKLMVIDDLANRVHQCDLLLDQSCGRKVEDYAGLVPKKSQLMLGSKYALLRSEFAEWRDYSLKRRVNPGFKKLLITMGGVDSNNRTGQLLKILSNCSLPKDLEVNVVMGSAAIHLKPVKRQAELMPYKTNVKVNVSNMAELMANADWAIGAAGATTWERCCLGLPSFMVVLAENQRENAYQVSERCAAIVTEMDCIKEAVELFERKAKKDLLDISKNAEKITDGLGVARVIQVIKGTC